VFNSFEDTADKANLFVKNIPRNMSEPKLHQLFSTFGEVASAKIMVIFCYLLLL
jgi:RNA recognition motif-containing protein